MTNPNGQHEPALSPEPTQRALNIQSSFLIVEGKSHATGKPIFEAENQAAVAGACALKILLDLADLADRADVFFWISYWRGPSSGVLALHRRVHPRALCALCYDRVRRPQV